MSCNSLGEGKGHPFAVVNGNHVTDADASAVIFESVKQIRSEGGAGLPWFLMKVSHEGRSTVLLVVRKCGY